MFMSECLLDHSNIFLFFSIYLQSYIEIESVYKHLDKAFVVTGFTFDDKIGESFFIDVASFGLIV